MQKVIFFRVPSAINIVLQIIQAMDDALSYSI